MKRYKVEVCVDTLASVEAARKGGADRVELCAALSEGGLTPSMGLVRAALQLAGEMEVYMMIRPRTGDFLYSQDEKQAMLSDIALARELGVGGIVLGALTEDGSIDEAFIDEAVRAAGCAMSVTYHRAFDVCKDRSIALEQLYRLGVNRILTSGGARTAIEGREELRRLIDQAGDRLIIMPGAGVGVTNIQELRDATGAKEFHLSARTRVGSPMLYRNASVSMGIEGVDEYSLLVANAEIVAEVVAILNS